MSFSSRTIVRHVVCTSREIITPHVYCSNVRRPVDFFRKRKQLVGKPILTWGGFFFCNICTKWFSIGLISYHLYVCRRRWRRNIYSIIRRGKQIVFSKIILQTTKIAFLFVFLFNFFFRLHKRFARSARIRFVYQK